jgi:hypothetical protein
MGRRAARASGIAHLVAGPTWPQSESRRLTSSARECPSRHIRQTESAVCNLLSCDQRFFARGHTLWVCHSEPQGEESSEPTILHGVYPERRAKTLRAVYPERGEKILRCAQNDGKRRAQSESKRRVQNDVLERHQPVMLCCQGTSLTPHYNLQSEMPRISCHPVLPRLGDGRNQLIGRIEEILSRAAR